MLLLLYIIETSSSYAIAEDQNLKMKTEYDTDVLGKLIRGVHVAVIVEQLEDIHSHVIHHPGVFCSHHQVSNDARVICHLSCESLTNLVKLLNLQLETVCIKYRN